MIVPALLLYLVLLYVAVLLLIVWDILLCPLILSLSRLPEMTITRVNLQKPFWLCYKLWQIAVFHLIKCPTDLCMNGLEVPECHNTMYKIFC